MTLGQNSLESEFAGAGAEELKQQKSFFLKTIYRQFEYAQYVEKSAPLSQLEGKI